MGFALEGGSISSAQSKINYPRHNESDSMNLDLFGKYADWRRRKHEWCVTLCSAERCECHYF
jgi:hypothetical protein